MTEKTQHHQQPCSGICGIYLTDAASSAQAEVATVVYGTV